MSTPAPPRPPGALHAAQQQLDELDALIQRMLTLPANPGDEPVPPETSGLEPALEASTPTDQPVLEDSPSSLADASAPPEPRRDESKDDASVPGIPRKIEPPPRKKRAPVTEEAVEFLPTPLFDPLEVEFRPVPLGSDASADGEDEVLAPAEPFHSESPAAQYEEAADEYADDEIEREPVAVAAPPRGPLVRANQAFDRLTYPLGSSGYWLRSAVGRDVLGWVGVLLITGSVAWAVLDWLGWTW